MNITKPQINRTLYIYLSAALSLPISEMTRDWMQFAEIAAYDLIPSPYQYRLLFAYTFHFTNSVMGVYIASWLFWFICLSVFLLLMDSIMTALNPNSTRDYLIACTAIVPVMIWFHPGGAMWSLLEAIFIAGVLLALIRGKTAVIYPLVFFATLNRETAILIPLMVFAVTRNWRHTAGLILVWGVTYGGMRLIIGAVPSQMTLADIWGINSGPQLVFFAMGLPLFGWIFWYAWKGWQRASGVMKGAAVIVPAYLVLFGIFGLWYEWRWILSLYPVLVVLGGSGVKETASRRSTIVFDGVRADGLAPEDDHYLQQEREESDAPGFATSDNEQEDFPTNTDVTN